MYVVVHVCTTMNVNIHNHHLYLIEDSCIYVHSTVEGRNN